MLRCSTRAQTYMCISAVASVASQAVADTSHLADNLIRLARASKVNEQSRSAPISDMVKKGDQ